MEHKGESSLTTDVQLYNGWVSTLPSTISGINQFSVAKLREILNHHGLPVLGTKDELVLRVLLLTQGETAAIMARQEEQVKDLIRIFKLLVLAQKKLYLTHTGHKYSQRSFSTATNSTFVPPPTNIELSNLQELFESLKEHIARLRNEREEYDSHVKRVADGSAEVNISEQIKEIGAKIHVKWTRKELGHSVWRPGWYVGYVQQYDEVTDILTVLYPSQPNHTYSHELTTYLDTGKLKLLKPVL